jgi:heat shock protein HtpX
MTQNIIKVEPSSIAPTLIRIILSAMLGGAVTVGVGLIVAMGFVIASGPLGWITLGPVVLAGAATALIWVLIGAPIAAVFGANLSTQENMNRTIRQLNIKLFSSGHPIHLKVQELGYKLRLPVIKRVGYIEDDNINAFAMGIHQNDALIVFTEGAITKLTKEELDAIIAHELAHVANNDMARMTYLRNSQNALTFFLLFRGLKRFARWVFSPISELEILSLSRKREYAADKIAAKLISPQAMASALEAIKIDQASKVKYTPEDNLKLSGARTSGFWRTHPPLNERIKAVRKIKVAPAQIATATQHDVIEVKPITEPIPKEIELIPTYKPWASAGLMSFGS